MHIFKFLCGQKILLCDRARRIHSCRGTLFIPSCNTGVTNACRSHFFNVSAYKICAGGGRSPASMKACTLELRQVGCHTNADSSQQLFLLWPSSRGPPPYRAGLLRLLPCYNFIPLSTVTIFIFRLTVDPRVVYRSSIYPL